MLAVYQSLQLATIKVGIDLKIFDVLAKSRAHVEVDQLVSSTGADPILLGKADATFRAMNST